MSCSLAPGRNNPGGMTPRVGWRARTSASAPTRCIVRSSTFGWYQRSIQSCRNTALSGIDDFGSA
jgi:hypothetical protein